MNLETRELSHIVLVANRYFHQGYYALLSRRSFGIYLFVTLPFQ
jgi:hypothetical protein